MKDSAYGGCSDATEKHKRTRPRKGWTKRPVEHVEGDTARISVAFTWNLQEAYQRAVWLRAEGRRVVVGGPAVALMPDYLADVAEVEENWPGAVQRHNQCATFTSRGCIRKCSFCAAWRIEGGLRELDDWPIRPIVCDNNLLATSQKHFDRVIDRLKPLARVDFNQGLDARLLTKYHAERLTELDCIARLAFDHISVEKMWLAALQRLLDAGMPKYRIRSYVLIGHNDTPEDALYRLELVRGLGIVPNPARYNPLDAMVRDKFVGPNWTHAQIQRYIRYWANLRFLGPIPFELYRG
jgi:hypothetical protein